MEELNARFGKISFLEEAQIEHGAKMWYNGGLLCRGIAGIPRRFDDYFWEETK